MHFSNRESEKGNRALAERVLESFGQLSGLTDFHLVFLYLVRFQSKEAGTVPTRSDGIILMQAREPGGGGKTR